MGSKLSALFFGVWLASCSNNLLLEPIAPNLSLANSLLQIKLRGIWVIGGQDTVYNLGYPTGANVIGQIDLYDPETDTWYPNLTSLPIPVSFAGAAILYNKIYVSGGWDKNGVARNELQIYDIVADRWSFGPAMPEPRAYHDLIALDDYIYATTGVNSNHDVSFSPRTQWFRYDPSLNQWTPRLALGYANSINVVAGGIIRVIGGRSNSTTIANYHDGYFPTPLATTDTSTTATAEITLARLFSSSISYVGSDSVGYIIQIGGINANLGGTWRNFVFHDLTSNNSILTNGIFYLKAPYESPSSWISLSASLPQALAFHRSMVYGKGAYTMGGSKNLPNPIPTNENWYLNLTNFPTSVPTPSAKSPMPVARYGHQLVRVIE